MSDQWQAFLRRDGDDQLLILTDVGIHDEIDSIAAPRLLRIDLQVKSADGYPDEPEDEALNAIEDHIVSRLAALGGIYAGRITRTGMRSLIHYVALADAAADKLIDEIEAHLGITVDSYVGDDPQHLVYKSLLYPTAEEWSLIHDVGVFEQLGENGDEREEPREVTHWAYFPDSTAAQAFAADVEAAGYTVERIGERPPEEPDGQPVVRFSRIDTPAFGLFTGANFELRKLAVRHGGEYDGWETMVVRKLQ